MSGEWGCVDCGWPWPLPSPPPFGAECDSCGGDLVALTEAAETADHEQVQS